MRSLAPLGTYKVLSVACGARHRIGGCGGIGGGSSTSACASAPPPCIPRRSPPWLCSRQMQTAAAKRGSEQFESTAQLAAWLTAHGVDPSNYGKGGAKTVAQLLEEVACGESVLGIIDGVPARSVSVVNVYIAHPSGSGQVLWEARQRLPDGRERCRGLPLSEKMLPAEPWRSAVVRGIGEELGSVLPLDWEKQLKLLENSYCSLVESMISPSYPGLATRYTRHTVRAELPCLPSGPFETREQRTDGELITWWNWLGGVEVP